jgi:hypothetical protein
MTAEGLALIAGSVLSLVFSYVPGLNARFAAKSAEVKRLIMLGLLVAVGAAIAGIACSGFGADLGVEVTCDRVGLVGLLTAVGLAAIANQTTYNVSPKTAAVQEARKDAAFETLAE